MNKEYVNIGKYDIFFYDKIIEKGTDIYLSNRV